MDAFFAEMMQDSNQKLAESEKAKLAAPMLF